MDINEEFHFGWMTWVQVGYEGLAREAWKNVEAQYILCGISLLVCQCFKRGFLQSS